MMANRATPVPVVDLAMWSSPEDRPMDLDMDSDGEGDAAPAEVMQVDLEVDEDVRRAIPEESTQRGEPCSFMRHELTLTHTSVCVVARHGRL